MKRSVQEIVELLVFGLIALLIGTALLWLVGWVFDLLGVLLKFFAGLIWSLLRFIVPVAIVAAIVYALVRLFQHQRERADQRREQPAATAVPAAGRPSSAAEEEGNGKKHLSEVWVPPQPSPPGRESTQADVFEEDTDADRRKTKRASAGVEAEEEAAGAEPDGERSSGEVDRNVAGEDAVDDGAVAPDEEEIDGERRS
jgi:uncharacterized membrane protein